MNTIYKPNYSALILSKNLEDLIEGYHAFEEVIVKDIVKTVLSYMDKFSQTKTGEEFEIEGIKYVFKYSYNEIERKYIIAVLEADVSRIGELHPIITEINEFGRIRSIEINCPKNLEKKVFKLGKILADQIKYGYLSFEMAFKNNFSEYENKTIKNVYERIEIEILRRNKEVLQKKFWLTITKLTTQKKDLFLFFLDSRTITHVIEIIKKNQTNLYSPFEILQCILFEEAPDAGIDYFNQNITEVTIEFKKQLKYGKKNNRYLNSQKILFDDTSFGFNYICCEKGLLLAVNYPEKYAFEFKEFLSEIKDDLTNIFSDNLNTDRINFGFLKKNKMGLSKIYAETKDFIATVIAKTIKEFSEAA